MAAITLRGLTQTLLLLLLSTSLFSQTGTIKGKVMDSQGVLVGARVYLENDLTKGSTSDINGGFIINNVPVGNQSVVVTYLGYESQTVSATVTAGEVVEIIATMAVGFVEGDEVIISAQRRGQTEAINQQLSSDKIANIVSSDRIQELPDVNAAEAIGRLPGVALNRSGGEGQKVVIRGMEPKFSAITVNGVRLPSNSSTDRSVDLSLIAPELLDAIEVFKSPLPDMDAEAIGGTVNLRLRKAPENFRMMTKGLYGYNDLASEFKDYKGILQMSNRFFDKKFGIIAQASAERFNRSGDFLTNNWRAGKEDSTGFTDILGSSLVLEDRQEIRKRYNASLSLDYDLTPKHSLSFFGVYSRTDRDQFRSVENYNPSNPSIDYSANGIENELSLISLSLTGDHNFNFMVVDWSLSSSQSNGNTPYNYNIRFSDTKNAFDDALNADEHPRNYFAAANPDLSETNLVGGESTISSTLENTLTGLVNVTIPFKLGDKISASFKFGGKYYQVDRSRDYDVLREGFYYLGGTFSSNAANRFQESGGTVTYLPTNGSLIGINTFLAGGNNPIFKDELGNEIRLNSNLDPGLIRQWYESQIPILNVDREAIVNRYNVSESITAGYAMFKLKFGTQLTVIPGFRYELSDNSYSAKFSTVSGRYGVNGISRDTTTFQKYGEILPHLHIKYQPLEWLDVRASFSQTLARPDFSYVTPRTQIDFTGLSMDTGNPNLKYSKATNYDLHVSAYKGTLGLLTAGVFYKDVANIFFPWRIYLADADIAAANGWPGYNGYEYNSYTNLAQSRVYGYELDLQTNLGFLPAPFNGIVLNANYARLYSETKAFFLTSETKLIRRVPPVFQTTYTTNERTVPMISQAPHIFHLSVGYDIKKFSARLSGIFQGTKASSYSLDPDFDRFDLQFWRWDASIKQGVGENWSIFLNLNNLTNQQDISFTRTADNLNTIQTYGFTGTIGLQYRIR